MPRRRPFAAERLAHLAWSCPQVIAHRLTGADRGEPMRMVTEKWAAAMESWSAMADFVFEAQRALMREAFRVPTVLDGIRHLQRAERAWSNAAAPYQRRAGANAKRLGAASRRRRRP